MKETKSLAMVSRRPGRNTEKKYGRTVVEDTVHQPGEACLKFQPRLSKSVLIQFVTSDKSLMLNNSARPSITITFFTSRQLSRKYINCKTVKLSQTIIKSFSQKTAPDKTRALVYNMSLGYITLYYKGHTVSPNWLLLCSL